MILLELGKDPRSKAVSGVSKYRQIQTHHSCGVAFKSMCKEEAHLVYKVQEVIVSKGKILSLLPASLLA